ncbi:MAG TPA: ABC transporter permease [Bryobacteraceae bacterium]|nr:ABC transporter permease [Bryobacteraceae bacterium]
MHSLKEFFRRLLYLGRRENLDSMLDQEVEFHIESRAEELQQQGLSRAQAMIQARREFGPQARMREESRGAWEIRWLEELLSDLRYAFRALRKSPGFALAAILSLALGIGANTTIFSLTMEFLFSVPSAGQPERLISIRLAGNSHSQMKIYRFVRDAHIFAGLAGSFEEHSVNWRNGEETAQLPVYWVTDNYFEVLGIPVAIGRPIQAGERNVAVVSFNFWQTRLSADPGAIGRTMILDGEPHTIVGILPRDHRTLLGFGFAPSLYVPVRNENAYVAFVARLPEGMTRQAAFGPLKRVAQDLDRVFPERDFRYQDDLQIDAVAGMERLKSLNMIPFTAFFAVLMVVVGLVLMIACANVASLLLARASSRRQELGIRLAIGAGRGRLVRQLLSESLLLAVLGTLSGLLLNFWLTSLISRIQLPLPLPFQLHIAPDWRLIAYSAALAFASALFCGLFPALKATRADLNSALKREDFQDNQRRWNMRNALVVAQLATSTLLLAAGLLFLQNLSRSTSMNPGFDVDHTLVATARLVPANYPTPEKTQAFVTSALDSLRAIPGVQAASIAHVVPLNGQQTNGIGIKIDGVRAVHVQYKNNNVGPDYFRVMGIPILAGREFSPSDRASAPHVAILNENFARQLFGNASPIGHRLDFPYGESLTIVGVARNSKYFTLGEVNAVALYVPFAQAPAGENLSFLIRAAEFPPGLVKDVTKTLGELDQTAAVDTKPMRDALVLALLPSRAGAAIFGSMGVLGLLLASVGLYGVLAYTISRRIREIGLRMALGAEPRAVLRMVFRDSFLLVASGLAIGLGIAIVVTRPLSMFLVPGLSPTDPVTYFSVIALLATVAIAATVGPALRALRVDPMVALRYE